MRNNLIKFGALIVVGTIASVLFGTIQDKSPTFGETQGSLDAFKIVDNKILPRVATKDFGLGSTTATSSAPLSWDTGSNLLKTVNLTVTGTCTGCGGSFSGLDFGTIGGSEVKISSISFDANMFDLSTTASKGFVRLDWTNGPASRSAANTWSALNTFTASPLAVQVTGNASVSNNFSIDNLLRVGTRIAGDSLLQFGAGTTASVSLGVKDTDSNAFVISNGGTLGTSNMLRLTTGGASLSSAFEVSGYASMSNTVNVNNFGLIMPTQSLATPASGGFQLYNTGLANNLGGGGVYEAVKQYWNGSAYYIATTAAGGGTVRQINIGAVDAGAGGALSINPPGATSKFSFSRTTTTTATNILNVTGAINATNATQNLLNVNGTVTQSSTGAYNGVLINPTIVTHGSGNQRLISAQGNSTDRFVVDINGLTSITASVSGARTLAVTGTASISSAFEVGGYASVSLLFGAQGWPAAAGTPSSVCENTTNGQVVINPALTCTVSARDQKTNIDEHVPFSWLSLVKNLNPLTFAYKDQPNRIRMGFIADEVEAVDKRFGDAFDKNNNARSIDLPAITAANTGAIKELAKQVAEQQKEIENLKQQPGTTGFPWHWLAIGFLGLVNVYLLTKRS